MRDYSTAVDNYIADVGSVRARHLVWITAKTKSSPVTEESIGFWNGIGSRQFTIGGETRTYLGAGQLLSMDPITASVGLQVRMHRLALSSIPAEVQDLILTYDTRLAPVEVHRALFNVETNELVSEPTRVLKGTIEEMPVPRPAEGETATMAITVASASRALTRGLSIKKSDAAQRAIDPTDEGRKYASISGVVTVFWGKWDLRGAARGANPLFTIDNKDEG